MNLLLAAISGSSLINSIIMLVVAGLVFWLLLWLIDYAGIPQPFNRVAKVILAVIAVIFLINFLLSLIGHPIIRWS